jgi:ubiquinone/menaquinone biosynthesis C-methylase UbiE
MISAGKEILRENTVKEYFSRHSAEWDSFYNEADGQQTFTSYELQRRKEIVFDLISGLGSAAIHKVLDLGCGSGRYLAQLASMGFDCCGADISEEMLQIAREKLPPSSSVKLIRSDCCNVPVEDHYFDLIICAGVLEYLARDTEALDEIRRLITPGGFAILTLPNLCKLRNLLNPYYYLVRIWTYLYSGKISRPAAGAQPDPCIQLDYGKSTVRRYSLFKARRLAAASGFRVVDVRSCCFGPFSLWKNEILKTGTSIKVSDALERLLSHKTFGFLRFFANRWVLLVQSESSDHAGIT